MNSRTNELPLDILKMLATSEQFEVITDAMLGVDGRQFAAENGCRTMTEGQVFSISQVSPFQ